MKATLRFDLEEPGERMAHLRCVKALDLTLALYSINELMWKLQKEEQESITVEDLVSRIGSIYSDYGIELNELTC